MRNERNRTICTFEYKGYSFGIHERKNPLSNGEWHASRFLYEVESGNWCAWASNKREGIAAIDKCETATLKALFLSSSI